MRHSFVWDIYCIELIEEMFVVDVHMDLLLRLEWSC